VVERGEVAVRVTHLGEELDCETSTFDPNRVSGTDPAQLRRSSSG